MAHLGQVAAAAHGPAVVAASAAAAPPAAGNPPLPHPKYSTKPPNNCRRKFSRRRVNLKYLLVSKSLTHLSENFRRQLFGGLVGNR